MSRPQRNINTIERFRARPVANPRNAPVQQQVQPAQPAQQAQARARARRQPRRVLDLVLKQVDANMYDIGDPESEFYDKYYDKPQDSITERLNDIDYSKHKYTVSLLSGITTFELKNIDDIPLNPVSFQKFKDGGYQNEKTKSDARYAKKINKFTNQFPSFKQYQKSDDLTWIVRKHRLLMCELLEYAIQRNLSLSSIEGKINTMMRVMLLALGTKQHVLYIKYSQRKNILHTHTHTHTHYIYIYICIYVCIYYS